MQEDPRYLNEQLITYIGNKRALLQFIGKALETARQRTGKQKISTFDVFSGSGVVSRFLKQYSSLLISNDLEKYASLINRCYLANKESIDIDQLNKNFTVLTDTLTKEPLKNGIISEFYAPADDTNIKPGERVFYTNRNARYLDTARQLIDSVPEEHRHFFLAPLLAEASVHANTSGVFKGFYKNAQTGVGTYGGTNEDALIRIKGDINLPFPVFSNFNCETHITTGDANIVCESVPEVDVAYLDPPYNQHPYGSNYFMLNLLLENRMPQTVSSVSGIPPDWNRSAYNKKPHAFQTFSELIEKIRAKFLIISFNSEGFISREKMTDMLSKHGKLEIMETKYNTFRGSRNLADRNLHVTEFLYFLEKK